MDISGQAQVWKDICVPLEFFPLWGRSKCAGGGRLTACVFPFPQPPSLSGLMNQVAMVAGTEIMLWASRDFSSARLISFQQQ